MKKIKETLIERWSALKTSEARNTVRTVGLLILSAPLSLAFSSIGICISVNAYILSRSVAKMNRNSMRYSGDTTSENSALWIEQGLVGAFLAFGLDPSVGCVLFGTNAAIFSVARSIVKWLFHVRVQQNVSPI